MSVVVVSLVGTVKERFIAMRRGADGVEGLAEDMMTSAYGMEEEGGSR